MNHITEVILRTCAVYIFIVLAIRLFGKKELTQLSVTDLVFIMLISNSVQNAMVGDNTTLYGGLAAATALFGLNFILKLVFFKNKSVSKFFQGEPVMLIHNGKILHSHLNKQKLTVEELEASAREHGVSSLENVNLAVLETDGTISILSEDYHHKSNRKRKVSKTLPKGL